MAEENVKYYHNIVYDINQSFYDEAEKINSEIENFVMDQSPLSYITDGWGHGIKLFGITIWCSENDERPYENEDDPILCDVVPLKPWLENEIIRILSLMEDFKKMAIILFNKEK